MELFSERELLEAQPVEVLLHHYDDINKRIAMLALRASHVEDVLSGYGIVFSEQGSDTVSEG